MITQRKHKHKTLPQTGNAQYIASCVCMHLRVRMALLQFHFTLYFFPIVCFSSVEYQSNTLTPTTNHIKSIVGNAVRMSLTVGVLAHAKRR